jgi:hypothetical protein
MKESLRTTIPTRDKRAPRSLCWEGDKLVDWAYGGTRYGLDGTMIDRQRFWAYRFDRAAAFADGRYVVVYRQLGTKGVILKEGRLLREINRSYYCAEAYEYPVALLQLPDGRDVIVHCPDEYNRLEIEEIESGRRLTARESQPADFFHSRLEVSPGGQYLLSAGWIWHPLDQIEVFDLQQALRDPASLDRSWEVEPIEELRGKLFEIHSATFLDADTFVFYGSIGYGDAEESEARSLGLYNLKEHRLLSCVGLEEVVGTMMPLGEFVVSFHEHPKLIEISSGEVMQRWPEISSGRQNSSIIGHEAPIPPMAFDPANRRFAVAGEQAITVIQLG